MSSGEDAVRKLGKLSKLALSDVEVRRFGEQTDKIIGYFRSLQALKLAGVEPTSHVVDVECYRRPDEPGPTLKCLDARFPYLKYGFFQVPRIIERASEGVQRTQDGTPDE